MELTETDKAYIGGIFDSEGCVGIYHTKGSNGKVYHTLRVSIEMTDIDHIAYLRSTFDDIGSLQPRPPRYEGCKPSIAWVLGAKDSVTFLMTVYEYIFMKRPQVDCALEFAGLDVRDCSCDTVAFAERELYRQELMRLK